MILSARVIGGLQMVDKGEADDKIIAVLHNDEFWKKQRILPRCLARYSLVYATTLKRYKRVPGHERDVRITETYGREHAYKVVRASIEDYEESYG